MVIQKAHQLGWLKTKHAEFFFFFFKIPYVLTITVGYSITMEHCPGNRKNIQYNPIQIDIYPIQIQYNPILIHKFKKSYDLPLDLLQYRKENSAEYLYS